MNKAQLQSIANNNYAVPEGLDPEELIPELTECLGSTDPILRERSFEILMSWGTKGRFSDDALRGLGERMVDGLFFGLGEPDGDSAFRRSYSALVLCTPIGADQLFAAGLVKGRAAFLAPKQVRTWCARTLESVRKENDLRGFVDGKGWAHTVAHKADALCQFARSPHSRDSELRQILNCIADRLTCPADSAFVHDEGGRLMRAAYHVLLRRELPLDTLTTWLEKFAHTPDGRTWGFGQDGIYDLEHCDQRAANGRLNVGEALRSLYFYLKLGLRRWHSEEDAKNAYYAFFDRPILYRDELLDAVDSVLRQVYGGLYPPK